MGALFWRDTTGLASIASLALADGDRIDVLVIDTYITRFGSRGYVRARA
jgi:hypothetical protein